MSQQLFQHILIFGHEGAFTVRFDNDASTEETFQSYPEALFRVIRYLATIGGEV